MSKARELAELGAVYNSSALSNRNLIINGAMQVAQRGNRSASGFTGAFYAGPDRWLVNRSGTGSTGFSQISSTAYGGTKAAQATFLAAAGETYIVTQRIEAANIAHLAGQEVTLSFWVSGSNDTGAATLNASLSYASVADNFTSETVIGTPQSISYTGTAQRITMTVTLPSGASNGVAVRLAGTKTDATGTFTLTFGGVQLEVGDTATPFEHRSYADELARCQRYYERWDFPNSFDFYVSGTANNAHDITSGYNGAHVVSKRALPTFSTSGTFVVDNLTSTAWTHRAGISVASFYNSASASGRYYSYNSGAAAYIFDAEL